VGRDDGVVLREPATGAGRESGASADVPLRDRGGQDFWPGVVGGICHVGLLVRPADRSAGASIVAPEGPRVKEFFRGSRERLDRSSDL